MLCYYPCALGKLSLVELPTGAVLNQTGTWQERCWQVPEAVPSQTVTYMLIAFLEKQRLHQGDDFSTADLG